MGLVRESACECEVDFGSESCEEFCVGERVAFQIEENLDESFRTPDRTERSEKIDDRVQGDEYGPVEEIVDLSEQSECVLV